MSRNRFFTWTLLVTFVLVGMLGCSDPMDQPLGPGSDALPTENGGIIGQEIVISVAPGWTFQQVATANGWKLLQSNPASGLATYDDKGTLKMSPGKSFPGVVDIEANTSAFDDPEQPWGDENFTWGGDPDPLSGQAALDMFDLDEVHQSVTGVGIRVALIDTGVDTDHPALRSDLYFGPYNKVIAHYDGNQGHGTAVAGAIKAMAPDAQIFPIDVFNGHPEANRYTVANALHTALDYDADVVCLALSSNQFSVHVTKKIQALVNAGVFVAVAAGNTHGGSATFPATEPAALSVGATTDSDVLAPFSASGSTVEFAAVGQGILTLWIPDAEGTPRGTIASGTSLSAGFMAGYCALAVKAFGNKTYGQLLADFAADAVPVSGVAYGRINTEMLIRTRGGL